MGGDFLLDRFVVFVYFLLMVAVPFWTTLFVTNQGYPGRHHFSFTYQR